MLEAASIVGAINPPVSALCFANYAERVIDRWKLAGKQTYREDRSRLATMIVPHAEWAQLPLDQITRGEVRQWSVHLKAQKHARGKLYGNQSIKHALNLVRGIFAAAIEDELIQTNPAEGVKPPKRRKGEQQDDWTALEPREIKRLLSHPELTYEQRTVFSLAIYTGLREGELAALLRTDLIDLDGADPHLTVTKSWDDASTKTGKSRRVALIPAAVKMLREWLAHTNGSVSKNLWGHIYARGYDWGWARKIDKTRGVCWLGAPQRAGIRRKVWFHHLRDTCASNLLTGTWGRKWSVTEVASMLGH
jgi:integrase